MKSIARKSVLRFRKMIWAICILGAISFTSCLPPYSAKIARQIDYTSQSVDSLYSSMLKIPESDANGRTFTKYADQYRSIGNQLDSLLKESEAIPRNKKSVRICKNTITLWSGYQEEHKNKNTLSDNLIQYNKGRMTHSLDLMRIAENAKKKE